MLSQYYNPVSITFGRSSLDVLRDIVGEKKAALVTFAGARRHGLIDRVQQLLGASLVHIEDSVQSNPDVTGLASMYKDFWTKCSSCHYILALGGGSVIDAAKVLMTGTPSQSFDELGHYLQSGREFQPKKVIPLIAIPTTSGTGSEVTAWATVWDKEQDTKYSLHLPHTWASHAVLDPELMLNVPAEVTLSAGLDALSHALESIWNINANPISDMYAVSAARNILEVLPQLMRDLTNVALRERMALASLQAGLAFSNTQTAIAHSISYDLTLEKGIPHGIACSFTLPMVLSHVQGLDEQRDAVLREVFGADLEAAVLLLEKFFADLGVQTKFAAYGYSRQDAERIIAKGFDGARGKNYVGHDRAWQNMLS